MVDRFGLAAPTAKDHPRVCGEKFHVGFNLLADVQSPPRVRGKEGTGKTRTALERITPACAGKSIICRDIPL